MQLLVSVRSAAEALDALAGGAGLIDVKEPSRGPLGAADHEVIAEVVRVVAGRCPVSAALGELRDWNETCELPPGVQYVKWGLAGLSTPGACEKVPALQTVLAAYADADLAQSPPVMDVLAFAIAQSLPVLLIDTFAKMKGRNLLHFLTTNQLAIICESCRAHRIKIALAGSLGLAEIEQLRPLRPDWFAVRGAACTGDDRTQHIDRARVARLVQLLT